MYINVCMLAHPHWKPLHPLRSRPRFGPAGTDPKSVSLSLLELCNISLLSRYDDCCVELEILTLVNIEATVFWEMSRYKVVVDNRFREICCLHLQSSYSSKPLINTYFTTPSHTQDFHSLMDNSLYSVTNWRNAWFILWEYQVLCPSSVAIW
jgi:hypothetical protein